MSVNATFPSAVTAAADPDRMHRLRLRIAYLVAIAATTAILVYGFGYYIMGPEQRALSPKHDLLKHLYIRWYAVSKTPFAESYLLDMLGGK